MRLDGYGLFVRDMGRMIRFYRDVLGFEIKEAEDADNVYLVKDGTLFLLYGRKDFEKMTGKKFEYLKGVNAHAEMALDEVPLKKWTRSILMPLKTAPLLFFLPLLNHWDRELAL